jgi:hypothetical protein
VLVTGLTAAVLVATINPTPAQAFPTKNANCTGCHAAGGATTAAPSTLTPAAGAPYTVAITLQANPAGGNSGYAIVPVVAGTGSTNGGNASAALSYSATMTAPAAAGTYVYNVYTNQGLTDPDGFASGTKYTITVAAVVTTPPPTTTTTTPPTTTTTTVPPTTTTTTPPVTTRARIYHLSPDEGYIGTKVTITGTGFGKAGVVKFGSVVAKASFYSATKIVVVVPSGVSRNEVDVTVTPAGGVASKGAEFEINGHHHGDDAHRGDVSRQGSED